MTREQRYTIEALLQTPMSLREIGEAIGVSSGTVSRERSGLEMTYRLRDNNSAGLCFKIPSTSQYLIVNTSFSKLMSTDWLVNLEADVKEFMAISERLGRMKVSWCRID